MVLSRFEAGWKCLLELLCPYYVLCRLLVFKPSLGFPAGIATALPMASSATTATVRIVIITWSMKMKDKKQSR